MADPLTMYRSGVAEFAARLRAVRADQWDAPTPDRDWSVNDLVDHLFDEQRWVPPLVHGHDLATAGEIVRASESRDSGVLRGIEVTGIDRVAEWDDLARASVEAFGEPDALTRDVALSRGPTPAGQYLLEMTFDLIVHSWDLGRAIGYQGSLPEEAAGYLYQQVQRMGDLSESGLFDKPVDVPDDASTIDKLIAYTGRDPR
jgi:uncharacterized protein (TIGR03086 family)